MMREGVSVGSGVIERRAGEKLQNLGGPHRRHEGGAQKAIGQVNKEREAGVR